MQSFLDDESGYLRWLESSPNGFLINSNRNVNSTYLMLHRATCRTISGTPSRGKDWTKNYVKVCSNDLEELAAWAKDEIQGSIVRCGICRP